MLHCFFDFQRYFLDFYKEQTMARAKINYKDVFFDVVNSLDFKKKMVEFDLLDSEYKTLISLMNRLKAQSVLEVIKERTKKFKKTTDKQLIDLLGGPECAYRVLNDLCPMNRTTVQHWYSERSVMQSPWRILILLVLL